MSYPATPSCLRHVMFRAKWPLGSIKRGYVHPLHPPPAIVLGVLYAATYFAVLLGYGTQLVAMMVVSMWFGFRRDKFVRRGCPSPMPSASRALAGGGCGIGTEPRAHTEKTICGLIPPQAARSPRNAAWHARRTPPGRNAGCRRRAASGRSGWSVGPARRVGGTPVRRAGSRSGRRSAS